MDTNGNIFLVGLMGTGKTTIGKQLAKQLGKTFIDADQELERRTGVSIPHIFDLEGEAGFRQRETNLLAELAVRPNIVLATGGGVVLNPANRHCLKANGTVVYLRASIDELVNRTRQDRNRPLLQTQDPRARFTELEQMRAPLYAEIADITLDTGTRPLHAVLQQLVQQLGQAAAPAPKP